jgi:hypothetical protein
MEEGRGKRERPRDDGTTAFGLDDGRKDEWKAMSNEWKGTKIPVTSYKLRVTNEDRHGYLIKGRIYYILYPKEKL